MKFVQKFLITAVFLLISAPTSVFAQAGISEMHSWIEGKLAAGNSSSSSFIFLFLGGLLSSLSACVYPLSPVTATVIKLRGATSSRFVHRLSYFSGLAAIYLLFG